MPRTLLAALALALPCALGCADLGIVARRPWIEDRSLALDAEVLTLRVAPDSVSVDAWFQFRAEGRPRDRTMTFPIAAPRGASDDFAATLEGSPAPQLLASWRAQPGALPAGDASETWDTDVPGDALAAHEGALRVRYRQRGKGAFAYTLRTGAYWRGPIRTLDVVVEDPERLVERCEIEGVRIERDERAERAERGAGGFRVRLVDSEPRGGVALWLR